ncbi:lysophospholipase-like protein 1 [Planococcus citri]|uniref:lysophospholipase-like protein 1 n=1 Tax=Planococcus citri TaxID=170843 RepID=UPI0031F74012
MASTFSHLATFLLVISSFDWSLVPQVSSQRFINRRVWKEADSVIPPKKEHKATIFFLHNIHNSGVSMRYWWQLVMPDSQFEHIKLVFPNGVRSYYAPLIGMERLAWYNQQGIGPEYPELRNDTYEIAKHGLNLLVKEETDWYNITTDKIIIGGFDQGGTMAMHMAFREMKNIGGCFALSSYLCHDSILYKELPVVDNKELTEPKLPYLFYVNGKKDPKIKLEWAQETFKRLERRGVKGEFHIDGNVTYELKKLELYQLRNWAIKRLGVD